MSTNPYDSVRSTVQEVFRELVGDRAEFVNDERLPAPIMSQIADALVHFNATAAVRENADEIAFHISDWNAEAAFIVALHLFPERFSPEEIRAEIDWIAEHVPRHLIALARRAGKPAVDAFALCEPPPWQSQ